MAVFIKTRGNQSYAGTGAEYDQVDYPGAITEYVFTRNPDGTITVTHETLGTDTLTSIEGLWFQGEETWYSIDDALGLTNPGGNTELIGTNGDDSFVDPDGDTTIDGNGGAYNQVDYSGALADYTFTLNEDGTVTVEHPTRGTDTLTDIDGLWFQGEGAWYSMNDAIAASGGGNVPTTGDDTLTGTDGNDVFIGSNGNDSIDGNGGAYNQVDYAGSLADYDITQNADGTVTVAHSEFGTDTLTDIDGLWFQGEAAWYSIADAIAGSTTTEGGTFDGDIYTGTQGADVLLGSATATTFYSMRGNDSITGRSNNDTLNVDGDAIEWTFGETADGLVTMSHAMWGVKTIDGVETILFGRSGESMTVAEAIAATEGLPDFRVDADGVTNGTPDDDIMTGTAETEYFYGGVGDDSYDGQGAYDQLNYDGLRSEYTITQNEDGSFEISHEIWGTDTAENIEGFYFAGNNEWVSADNLI